MRLVNHLTEPGGIRRVDINAETVVIATWNGQDRIYRLSTSYERRKDEQKGIKDDKNTG